MSIGRKKLKTFIILLLTHDRLIIRFVASWLIGTGIFFTAWFISDAWLPNRFFRFLPLNGDLSC